jgi:hypothetical protein
VLSDSLFRAVRVAIVVASVLACASGFGAAP